MDELAALKMIDIMAFYALKSFVKIDLIAAKGTRSAIVTNPDSLYSLCLVDIARIRCKAILIIILL